MPQSWYIVNAIHRVDCFDEAKSRFSLAPSGTERRYALVTKQVGQAPSKTADVANTARAYSPVVVPDNTTIVRHIGQPATSLLMFNPVAVLGA